MKKKKTNTTPKQKPTRVVSFRIEEDLAREVEQSSGLDLNEIAAKAFEAWIADARRREEPLRVLGIAWPTDWYEVALQKWGERAIAQNVRETIYDHLQEYDLEVSPPPTPNSRGEKKVVKRKVQPGKGRQSKIQTTLIPQNWHDALLNLHGDGNVSTYVKALVYGRLSKELGPKDKPLSIPHRLHKFL